MRDHPTKFYFCDRIDETAEWVITVFEVRDVNGNLATPPLENEYTMFSAGCRITERMTLDTGSIHIPELEYVATSNEIRPIQQIERIDIETINAMINYHLRPLVIPNQRVLQSINRLIL